MIAAKAEKACTGRVGEPVNWPGPNRRIWVMAKKASAAQAWDTLETGPLHDNSAVSRPNEPRQVYRKNGLGRSSLVLKRLQTLKQNTLSRISDASQKWEKNSTYFARYLREKRPLETLALIAGAAFLVGMFLGFQRSSHE